MIRTVVRLLALLALAFAGPAIAQRTGETAFMVEMTTLLATNPQLALDAANRRLDMRGQRPAKLDNLASRWVSAAARLRLGDQQNAARELSAIAAEARTIPDAASVLGYSLLLQGHIRRAQQDFGGAAELYGEAQRVFTQVRNTRGIGLALSAVAILTYESGDAENAIRALRAAEQVYTGDPVYNLTLRNNLGLAYSIQENRPEAERQFAVAADMARQLNIPSYLRPILINVAINQVLSHQAEAAVQTIRQLDSLGWQEASPAERLNRMRVNALIAMENGDGSRALRLVEAATNAETELATDTTSRFFHLAASDIFRANGSIQRAYAELAKVRQIDETNNRQFAANRAALLAAQFRFSAQETRIAQLQAEALAREVQVQRRNTFYIAAGSSMLLIALSALLVVAIRARNRAKRDSVELADVNQQLESALAVKSQFLASTSHELRTPLNGILGMTQIMLADDTLDAQTRARVDLVYNAGRTMRSLVDDILDVAKADHGGFIFVDKASVPATIANSVVQLFEGDAERRGISLGIDDRIGDQCLLLDASRVTQILFNLVGNALKFTNEGSIIVTARQAIDPNGNWLELAVRDSGIGIPTDWHDAVFDMFRQVDPTRSRQYGGTGLGLSICRKLARAMGGDILLESAAGEGSTFTIRLPWRPAPAELVAAPTPVKETDPRIVAVLATDAMRMAMLSAVVRRLGRHPIAVTDADSLLAAEEARADLMIVDGADARAVALLLGGAASWQPRALLAGSGAEALAPPSIRRVDFSVAAIAAAMDIDEAAQQSALPKRRATGIQVPVDEEKFQKVAAVGGRA